VYVLYRWFQSRCVAPRNGVYAMTFERARSQIGDIAYALLLILGVPAAAFHAVQDRWAQAILATAAIVTGVVILVTERREKQESEHQT
jgi:hypothetical protein